MRGFFSSQSTLTPSLANLPWRDGSSSAEAGDQAEDEEGSKAEMCS